MNNKMTGADLLKEFSAYPAHNQHDIPHVWEFEGEQTGPDILLLGGIHGTELLGVKLALTVVQKLTHDNILQTGSLTVALGNKHAIAAGTRASHLESDEKVDGNRVFEVPGQTIVHQRIRDLEKLIQESLLMIDAHQTLKPAKPFGIIPGEPKIVAGIDPLQVTSHFPVEYILTGPGFDQDPEEPAQMTDIYAQRYGNYGQGGIGITLELGSIKDSPEIQAANLTASYHGVLAVLAQQGMVEFAHSTPATAPKPTGYAYQKIIADPGFQFTQEWAHLDTIKEGQIYAKSKTGPHHAPKDSMIIFAKPPEHIDEGLVAGVLLDYNEELEQF